MYKGLLNLDTNFPKTNTECVQGATYNKWNYSQLGATRTEKVAPN